MVHLLSLKDVVPNLLKISESAFAKGLPALDDGGEHEIIKARRFTLADYFTIRYFLAALRLCGVSGVRCFPRSQTKAGNNVSYRNPKERIHARTLYYGDNDDARNRPRSDIFRRRATWPCSVFV